MPPYDCQVGVLGSGPVGMVAALELSQHFQTALITNHLPSTVDSPRVESVPVALLNLLLRYGIHPRTIGVDRFYEVRRMAWHEKTSIERKGPVAAHIERPALDLAILNAVCRAKRVKIISGHQSGSLEAVHDLRSQGLRLIDATGRRSVTASRRIRPARPWTVRTFLTSRQVSSAGCEFRIAALPGGFVYRLGSASHIVLGIVGLGSMVSGSLEWLTQHLVEQAASWILEGLPPLEEMTAGKTALASVQWTSGNADIRIGDAALARDTLSAQGLACGMSEAFYAAALKDDKDQKLLSLRQSVERAAHLRSLARLIARCRFRDRVAWSDYEGFIARHLITKQPVSTIALQAGNLNCLSPSQAQDATDNNIHT
jgi:2-polyprenyl-6-methoxyphenol hydroxylase-like FAD-dependent oxidoreductase